MYFSIFEALSSITELRETDIKMADLFSSIAQVKYEPRRDNCAVKK